MPRPGEVLGLVGTNGIGKSTALKILQSKIKPNLGRFDSPPDWQEILQYFRGSELQNYFTRILEDNLECKMKPQFVDKLASAVKDNTSVQMILDRKDQTDTQGKQNLSISSAGIICTLFQHFSPICWIWIT